MTAQSSNSTSFFTVSNMSIYSIFNTSFNKMHKTDMVTDTSQDTCSKKTMFFSSHEANHSKQVSKDRNSSGAFVFLLK